MTTPIRCACPVPASVPSRSSVAVDANVAIPGGERRACPHRYFWKFGESLRISQTDFGLFISYDRSVVEEYRFGENRLVSIGPIQAQRVSGWDGPVFVVETLDSDGSILFESWRLEVKMPYWPATFASQRATRRFSQCVRCSIVCKSGGGSLVSPAGRKGLLWSRRPRDVHGCTSDVRGMLRRSGGAIRPPFEIGTSSEFLYWP